MAERRARRGVWPIANGRVFAHVGLGEPAHRLFGLTGPHYQTRANHQPLGAFGEQWCSVIRDGRAVGVAVRSGWSELPGVVCARTEEVYSDGTVLAVADFALPEHPAILRRIEVRVGAGSAPTGLRFHFSERPNGALVWDQGVGRKRYSRDDRTEYRLLATVLDRNQRAELIARPGGFELPAAIAMDGRIRVDLLLLTSITAAAEAEALAAIQRHSAEHWQRRAVERGRAERSEWLRVEDGAGAAGRLVERVGNLIHAQRSLPGGAVAPMVHFKGVWLRDSNGPIRALLWLGAFDEVRAILRYYHAASALSRATHREFPLDLDVDDAPRLTAEQWAATGTDRCEVPSFVALQHLWYWEHTGDEVLIRDHYEWLRHNAMHQLEIDGPHGPIQPFNGDETYLHGAFYSRFPQRDTWPNQFPRADAFSADSSFTRLACFEAMAELAPIAGRTEHVAEYRARARALRAAIDAHYWCSTGEDTGFWAPARSPTIDAVHAVPYAPVNLAPLWLRSHAGTDPRARQNLATVIDRLEFAPGRLGMTPSVTDWIGSLPGYYLTNLVRANHPRAHEAFVALLSAATPGGGFAELHSSRCADWGYGDGTYPNRLRPWESGLNLCALLEFLTGARWSNGSALQLAPRRLAAGPSRPRWIGPLRVGASRVVLHWPAPESDGSPYVTWRSGPSCTVNGERVGPKRPRLAVNWHVPGAWTERVGPSADGAGLAPGAHRTLVLTVLPAAELRSKLRAAEATVFDIGLPIAAPTLGKWVSPYMEGRLRWDRILVGSSALRADRRTMKSRRYWRSPALQAAFARARRAGCEVLWGVAGL